MQPEPSGRRLEPVGTFARLREAFFRYYETPFGLADDRLQRERRQLLDRDGGVFRYPLIELRPEYVTADHDLADSVRLAGAPEELSAFAASGLIPERRSLYLHQEQALSAGLTAGQHMVITAGTGSGKTESFLLPVLASLLAESRDWGGSPAPAAEPWWQSDDGAFQAQRLGETGRSAAVRAVILYPMNALVDDQLTRLRKALDSDPVRTWLDDHRRGHRFFFGRYTGATPVTGSPLNNLAVRDLRQYLRETQRRGATARRISERPGYEDVQYFVPRLDGAEMRSRWDMAAAPPDILITNYSMLNVMLLRERDGHFFDSTRAWLDESESNRFTLVVDELHMYRGTAGTEVAYLLRALKHRLGLDARPDQLRVLAASASLDAERDAGYLRDFFGVSGDRFSFIQGDLIAAERDADPVDLAQLVAVEPTAATDLARDAGVLEEMRRAFTNAEGAAQALPLPDLSGRLFPKTDTNLREVATEKILAGLAASPREGDPRLRAHMFFRNVPGVWACSDPECPDVPGGAYETRRVGRLFVEPTTRCTCGARVLELLYCQNCGDVFLGGFTPEMATQAPRVDALLLADIPELAKLPDQVKLERTAANYLVYWPQPVERLTEIDRDRWTADNGNVTYRFRRSRLHPGVGALTNDDDEHTGWSFHVVVARAGNAFRRDPNSLSPYPTLCPSCGDNWEIRYGPAGPLPHTDPLRQRSPIRGMRTGFEKINQVLTTELASDLPPNDRKLIVFTDSRQDAAKLSSGLALRHYQDLLRMLLYQQLQRRGDSAADVALARQHVVEGIRSDASWQAIDRLRERDRATFDRLRDVWERAPGTAPEDEEALSEALSRAPTLAELATVVTTELLRLGMNPGGPHARLQQAGDGRDAPTWTTLYDWDAAPPRPRAGLGPAQQRLQVEIDESLMRELLEGLFSGAGRDFESLGLGWLALADDWEPADAPTGTPTALARTSLRVLAGLRRFRGMRDGRTDAPPKLRRLWKAIAEGGGPDEEDLAALAQGRWGTAVTEYVIDPARVVLRLPGDLAWICQACHRQHLNRGCGRCNYCTRPLPEEPGPRRDDEDYYAWKALAGDGRFALRCAELTGQTDRLDAQARQARFQGVFLEQDENALPDGLELLSVTTTMEAGVDIGALSAVVLGNMPPTRFNYQQRVGRAGRRGAPVAVALTVCRGRSHDEYYFDRPSAITNDPTPRPYLALGRPEIFLRSLRSEVLRLAMRDIAPRLRDAGVDLDFTSNVHGAFGLVDDWPTLRPALEAWLEAHGNDVAAAAAALAQQTPLAGDAAQAAADCGGTLLPAIDGAVAAAAGHSELSQRLAEHGVLPMFGFPSSVRYLHLRRPGRSYPWPPSAVIDRDLAMAAGQFAPLSEVVRDGWVHPVVGFAAFVPVRPRPQPEADALGPSRQISICRACSYLHEAAAGEPLPEPGTPCPRCGVGAGLYQGMTLREPLGFRAGPRRDFDGNFSWSPRAMAARALTDLDSLDQVGFEGSTAFSGRGRRFVINDNGGTLFEVRPATGGQDWGGYLSVAAIERGLVPAAVGGDPFSVAIGAVQATDFLFIGPNQPTLGDTGLRLNLGLQRQLSGARDATDGRRGAWYSLAFLLRTAAASQLDVQPLELTAGVYAGLVGAEPAAYAFIADTLENGAGFSSHLGTSEMLPVLMDRVRTYLDQLNESDHAGECAASCYRCLRDYGNMAYHALLDWRLARDLFLVLRGRPLEFDRGAEEAALTRWSLAYNATPIEGLPAACARFDNPLRGSFIVIARHPLEACEAELLSPRLAETCALAEVEIPEAQAAVFIDTFTLDRDPRRVLDMCDDVLATA